MCIRLRILIFMGGMLFGAWPSILFAYAPGQKILPTPTASFLLVASPKMTSLWFRESVILVTRTESRGPTGIIINRAEDIPLDRLYPEYPAARNFKLFAGGPVNTRQLSYLFRSNKTQAGTVRVSENIYLAYSRSLLGQLFNGAQPYTGLRVVNGLSGWMPGQLEDEIARGLWYVLPVDEEVIFDHPASEMWPELFRRVTMLLR